MVNHPNRAKSDPNQHAKDNARNWLASIRDMMSCFDAAVESDTGDDQEAREQIQESVLSVEIRDGWRTPGSRRDEPQETAEEYLILLTTGGPALRIIGDLNGAGEPENARLQWQDWGTPWTEYETSYEDDKVLTAFAGQFYFGE